MAPGQDPGSQGGGSPGMVISVENILLETYEQTAAISREFGLQLD